MARRVGAIIAVADFERSVAFYRDAIGFEVEVRCISVRRYCEGNNIAVVIIFIFIIPKLCRAIINVQFDLITALVHD